LDARLFLKEVLLLDTLSRVRYNTPHLDGHPPVESVESLVLAGEGTRYFEGQVVGFLPVLFHLAFKVAVQSWAS
jgi:hypothetical protein